MDHRYWTIYGVPTKMSGSVSIFPLWCHSLVCSENKSYFVTINTLLKNNITELWICWYIFSTCTSSIDQVL